jgi:hypothetical protein
LLVVIGDDLDLPAENATLGVDLVGRDLGATKGGGAGDCLHLGDHPNLDGIAGLRVSRGRKG